MHRCLADVAKRELETLAQDAKIAINSLQRQRESVIQIIQAAHNEDDLHSGFQGDTDLLLTELLDSVYRLDDVFGSVMREIQMIELDKFYERAGQPVPWSFHFNSPGELRSLVSKEERY